MTRRRANAGEGYGYMFHGAFAEKKDAQKKERSTKGAWIKPTWYKTGLRYVVMSPRTNPPKRRRRNSVATEILAQLGGRKFSAMTGAKNFVSDRNSLRFKLPANFARNGINLVRITLDPSDTYTLEFMKMRGTDVQTISTRDGVHADNLREVFTSETALDTSLGSMERNPQMYKVTREFTDGTLKGLTHTEITSTKFHVGQHVKQPLGGSPYKIISVKPVDAGAENPIELVVMGANPHERDITVSPGTTITIRTNPTNPSGERYAARELTRGRGLYQAPGLIITGTQRRVAGMVRRSRGRGRSHASADVKRDVILALVGQGYRRSDAKRAVTGATGEDFGALFRDAQSRIRGNPRELCGAMVGGEPCTRKPGHRGPHLPQGATLRPWSRLRRGWHPRGNPNEAADLRETFVGREPNEVITDNEPHMPAGDYAQLGELLTLYVKPRTGGQVQKITPGAARRPIVVSDTSARKIWFVGGDQDVSSALGTFGAAPRSDGRLELGEARRIDYKQRKEHVPDPEMDEWRHEFGEETGVRPIVVFDPTCKRLLLEGGEYEIRPEGIVN